LNYNSGIEVLVLSEDGTNLGQMSYEDAQHLAKSQNLDLVHINKGSDTGVDVFKIMDYGKWKYNKKKHNKQIKSGHHGRQIKEMNFRVRIDSHDQETKINRIKNFISKGADIKIMVNMRGREKSNPDLAHAKMNDILAQLADLVIVHQRRSTPSSVFVVVKPVHGKKNDKPKDQNGNIKVETKVQVKDKQSPTSLQRRVVV